MNRIGWFVVLVTASAVQSSLGDERPAENRGDFNAITKLKPVPEIPDPDVVQIRNFFDDLLGSDVEIQGKGSEARTFGHRRVTMMMLAPLMYKMGVMTTMLTVLIAISLKGLMIGLLLLMLKISSFLAKFHMGWQHQGHAWPPQPQPVHVHIQGGDGYHHSHGQPYSAWPSASGPQPDEEQHYYYKG